MLSPHSEGIKERVRRSHQGCPSSCSSTEETKRVEMRGLLEFSPYILMDKLSLLFYSFFSFPFLVSPVVSGGIHSSLSFLFLVVQSPLLFFFSICNPHPNQSSLTTHFTKTTDDFFSLSISGVYGDETRTTSNAILSLIEISSFQDIFNESVVSPLQSSLQPANSD